MVERNVQDDGDAAAMAGVDETPEAVRRPEARARSEQAQGLITPGAVDRSTI
jgi:hypothetical protein